MEISIDHRMRMVYAWFFGLIEPLTHLIPVSRDYVDVPVR